MTESGNPSSGRPESAGTGAPIDGRTGIPLSVVVTASAPWPGLRDCLDALVPQLAPAGAELLVALGGANCRPPDPAAYGPGIRWIEMPGVSVFDQRARAIAQARGDVVALTEDHAWVAPGWCAAILAAHAAHPGAVAIGGVVENGATGTRCDWANYLIGSGPFAAPIRNGPAAEISLQANVSYKRGELPPDLVRAGLVQLTFHRELRARGGWFAADDRVVVIHDQRHSFREHSASHFHNGRSIAASRLSGMGTAMRALRAAGCAVLPAYMLLRTTRAVIERGRHGREWRSSLPWIAWLLACHAAGEFAGYVSGPGRSRERVH